MKILDKDIIKKKKILDICCCGGGASRGIFDAGYEVTGIDIEPQPEYPFKFIQKDMFDLDPKWIADNFDGIWASPKCQKFSVTANKKRQKEEPNHIPGCRKLLEETGLPYIIENVPLAPLRKDLLLCGEMFGLRVIRHRVFEIKGFYIPQPEHPKHKEQIDMPVSVHQNLPEGLITEPIPIDIKRSQYATVAGNGGESYLFNIPFQQKAMGIDWIKKRETLAQAIPPKYSEYIFRMFKFQKEKGFE